MRFPFRDSPNTVTIACAHIIENQAPILHVTHDEDGMWQFLCGHSHDMSEARVVSLQEVYALDPSIAQLADMPRCSYADRRKSFSREKDSQWIIRKQ